MANLSSVLKTKIKLRAEKKVKTVVPKIVTVITKRQGKFSGELRASNNVAINAPDLSKVMVANYVKDAIGGTVNLATRNAVLGVAPFKLGDKVFISNNQEHAIYDEFKHGRLGYEGGKNAAQGLLD